MMTDLNALSLEKLRDQWAKAWGRIPHRYIGRKMLERSLEFKQRARGEDGLTPEQKQRLNKLIKAYKRNPNYFDEGRMVLKPGIKLVREWQGHKHVVTVTHDGFEYQNVRYNSLSKIANDITGSRWNGWLFFGLKKKGIS